MQQLKEIFNNREIAIGIWAIIALVCFIMKRSLRQSLGGILKSLFAKQIIISYLLAVFYTLCGVYILYRLGFWKPSQIKDTVLWTFTSFITLMKINKVKEDKHYFQEALKDNFKFALIVEFCTGLYTFSFIAELLLVPSVIFIGLMLGMAKTEVKSRNVQKFFETFLLMFGVFVFIRTIFEIYTHVKEFASYQTLRDFILSPYLAVWFLPFIYLMALYVEYEVLLMAVENAIKDPKLLKFAKARAIIAFRRDTEGFGRWKQELFRDTPVNKEQVNASINEIKRLQAMEKNPPHISPDAGWSPYKAKDFLADVGLSAGYYMKSYDDDWFAVSRYKKLDNSILPNSVAYNILGNEHVAKRLELALSISEPDKKIEAIVIFLDCVDKLFQMSLNNSMPKKIGDAIVRSRNETLDYTDKITVTIRKEDWLNKKSYSLLLYIVHT